MRVGLSTLRGTVGRGAPIRLLRKVLEDEEGDETEEEDDALEGRHFVSLIEPVDR